MTKDLTYKGTPVESWVQALNGSDAAARNEAGESLVRICASLTALLPALSDVLNKSDPATRAHSAAALGDFGGRILAIVPVLRTSLRATVLTTDDPEVRAAASEALVQIGPHARSPLPALIDNLKDELPAVRLASANTLAEIGPDARVAVAALTATAFNDPVLRVRVEAAVAIWRIDHRAHRVVPVLIDALKDPDEVTRWIAADCLGDIGAEARDALPALQEALQFPYKTRLIRLGVATAIERIEGAA
jgi:HEAT repeat protein